MITELPLSIGHLRNLQTLIADCNKIERLPDSICSCNHLRILSLAENNIKYLPDDLGRLSSLQVLNLCNNYLTYLPFSLTQITNLKSIWLSENQTKPLMPLHSETLDIQPTMIGGGPPPLKILTCFLLPQTKSEEHTTTALEHHSTNNSQRRKLSFLTVNIDKPLITAEKKDSIQSINNNNNNNNNPESFESNELAIIPLTGSGPTNNMMNKSFQRQPTPYPKDLKVQARHARNFVMKHLDLNNIYIEEIKTDDNL